MQHWEQFLREQEAELGPETVERWLRSLQVQHFDAGNLYLSADDSFQVAWFNEHIRPRLAESFRNNNGRPIRVHIAVSKEVKDEDASAKYKNAEDPEQRCSLHRDELTPHATFESFVESEPNQLVCALLKELCGLSENSLELACFNPIYIHGPSGAGKSHLLMATTKELQAAGHRVRYCRAESFTEHVVQAIRAGEMHRFRQSYRDTDVLIVDDVQVFSRKRATQEEFFHTFNTLHVENKQIILSADCAPQDLQVIEERLVSRFEWGIVLKMDGLKGKCLEDLLQKRLNSLSLTLEAPAQHYLLDVFSGSSQSLIRAVEALVLRTHMQPINAKLSVPVIEGMLSDLIKEEQANATTPTRIIATVAAYYGIKPEDILSKSQSRECVSPRKIAMYLCRELLEMPFMKIGDIFSRDHSTVISSVRQIQRALDDNNADMLTPVKSIRKAIKRLSLSPNEDASHQTKQEVSP